MISQIAYYCQSLLLSASCSTQHATQFVCIDCDVDQVDSSWHDSPGNFLGKFADGDEHDVKNVDAQTVPTEGPCLVQRANPCVV